MLHKFYLAILPERTEFEAQDFDPVQMPKSAGR